MRYPPVASMMIDPLSGLSLQCWSRWIERRRVNCSRISRWNLAAQERRAKRALKAHSPPDRDVRLDQAKPSQTQGEQS